MTSQPTVQQDQREWIERARSLEPLVERQRDEAEQQRHLPLPLADAMRERGLFSLWLPKSLGGPELTIETSVLVMEELSRQDGSVGWNSMISGNHSILWAHVAHDTAAKMIEGGKKSIIAGTIGSGGTATAPGGGVATVVPGGYRITGQWPFASGCHHADWMVANGRISENGELRKTPQGNVGLFSFLMSPSEVTLIDNWYTTGMRGTGSHDFEGENVFIPEDRVFSTNAPPMYEPSPLYTTGRTTPWSANIAGVSLGIGRCAIDTFVDMAKSKPANMGRATLMERETIHRGVGEAEGRLRSARAFLLETSRAVDAYIERGEDIPEDTCALMRCAASTASLAAMEVCDSMFTMAGMTSTYSASRLDRCFRDIHMVTQHVVGGLSGLTASGKFFMGLGLGQW
ncbi:MAG TPA: acyl-CoA dehydrogenase family protein [Dehalococcoidia bacterium]|nr:acyl-CoA dehydrogenase family protein [Dehalococcoidia bacterium]